MLSVLTFNLRFGLADDKGRNHWSCRKKVIPSLFEAYRPDFIGFQEVNDFQGDFLRSLLREYDVIGERKPVPRFWQNTPLFYKKEWKCLFHEHFFLSPTPLIPSRSRKSRWPRQCTMGRFEKGDRQVICANTHFDFDDDVQIESAKVIMERLSHLPHDLPAVLMGDFNATPSHPCHQVFTGEARTLGAPSPYFRNAFETRLSGTYHGFTGNPTADPIDWILCRGGIVPEDSDVIRWVVDGVYPSDHFPLYMTFRWVKG